MEFLDTATGKVTKIPPEEKPQRVARVNPDVLCGDCLIPGEELNGSFLPPVDRIVVPKDITDIADEDDIVYIIGTKDGKVTKIAGLEKLTKLKVRIFQPSPTFSLVLTSLSYTLQILVLRSCLVSKIEGLETNILLEKLELYDNTIEDIPSLHFLSNLRILDLSFNSIRTMEAIQYCSPHLEELYIAQNKLRTIEGLEKLVNLRILDLGANRIRVSRVFSIICLGFWLSNTFSVRAYYQCSLW